MLYTHDFLCTIVKVTKLIEDSKGPKVLRSAISQDRIVDWLVDEKILSIALEGTAHLCDIINVL